MSKNILVLGLQWGDEGKGKIVDLLTENVQGTVRFQGGNNAGHTLIVNDKKVILRLIPSGIFHQHVECFIGNGMVLSPSAFIQELDELEKLGVNVTEKLKISNMCSLLLPYHVALDYAREGNVGTAIGTTKRGIGPAYEDKVARRGLKASDLTNPELLAEKLEVLSDYHNFILQNYYHADPISFDQVLTELLHTSKRIIPMLADVEMMLIEYRKKNKSLLFEGAQGTLLDIDLGNYPFVTSSNTTAGAASTGSGFGPRYIDYILGIVKAYTTKVGAGPFPTELHDDVGKIIAERGQEFGSVTKRPRRCGWLDAVSVKRSIAINSVSGLGVMKIDVLDGLQTIRMCIDYKDGRPVYKDFSGWQENTAGINKFADLPLNAQKYLKYFEEFVETPIDLVSTGPKRYDVIKLRDI